MKLVGRKYIMELMSWSETTLWRKTKEGFFLQPLRLPGSHPRWDLAEVERFLGQAAGGLRED